MKNIRIALWAVLLGLTGLWLLADTLWPQPFHYFTFRSVAVQWTGVLAIGAMSVILVLAARPAWAERWLDGLDKSYRLHKWLGIAALAASVAHWWLALGTKWMVGWGWLVRPERGPRPKVTDPVQLWFNSQKGLADTLGEWAFYGGAALIVLALIKRFPYRWFAKTHTLLAVAYLALVYHSVIRTRFAYWAQPVGWVEAALMLAGSVAALMVLAGRVGAKRRVQATVQAADWLAPMQTLRMRLAVPPGWAGHAPGQFAFVSFSRAEGAHPYTIASAWGSGAKSPFSSRPWATTPAACTSGCARGSAPRWRGRMAASRLKTARARKSGWARASASPLSWRAWNTWRGCVMQVMLRAVQAMQAMRKARKTSACSIACSSPMPLSLASFRPWPPARA